MSWTFPDNDILSHRQFYSVKSNTCTLFSFTATLILNLCSLKITLFWMDKKIQTIQWKMSSSYLKANYLVPLYRKLYQFPLYSFRYFICMCMSTDKNIFLVLKKIQIITFYIVFSSLLFLRNETPWIRAPFYFHSREHSIKWMYIIYFIISLLIYGVFSLSLLQTPLQ